MMGKFGIVTIYIIFAIIFMLNGCSNIGEKFSLKDDNIARLNKGVSYNNANIEYAYIYYVSLSDIDAIIDHYISCNKIKNNSHSFLKNVSSIIYYDAIIGIIENLECDKFINDNLDFRRFINLELNFIQPNNIRHEENLVNINESYNYNSDFIEKSSAVPLFFDPKNNIIFCVEKERNSRFSDVHFGDRIHSDSKEKDKMIENCIERYSEE